MGAQSPQQQQKEARKHALQQQQCITPCSELMEIIAHEHDRRRFIARATEEAW